MRQLERNHMNRLQSILVAACVLALSIFALPRYARAQDSLADDAELVETRTEIPKLKAPATYVPKDNVVEIELSQYAGYSGLVAANNGMAPNEDSLFFKKYGFKLKLTISEEESWSALNSGKMAASATTADVLAIYGKQMDVVVPALIGYSRGADGIVVTKDIKKINDLKGKTLATAQFTEADFLIRYPAQEAGLAVNMLPNLATKPDSTKLNMVYCGDAFGAGDLFLRDLKAGKKRLAGCITWAPKTTEVESKSQGKAYILVTNRNLLIVADVLIVNKGFAKDNPKIMAGLVAGLIEGNVMVRENPDKYLPLIQAAFKWDADAAKRELAKVHLANFPENQAFFSSTMDSAGSFSFIFETATYVYGKDLITKQVDPDRLLDLSHLDALAKAGTFKDQKAAINPLRSTVVAEKNANDDVDALLSKNIRFKFTPNSSKLDMLNKSNLKDLESIAQMVRISPGSRILLRGHADGSLIEQHRRQFGETQARQTILGLKSLSKARCQEVQQILKDKYNLDASRIEAQGVGADEPTGQGADADRRVEVQWFTVE